jgi:uncharacterized protein (TIGR00730 family)
VGELPDIPFITVFCGARTGYPKAYSDLATSLGSAIAAAGAGLVYGGGRVGLMGVLSDATLAAGAPVHGVIPQALATRELAHPGLTRLDVVPTMHARKARMASVSSGFVILPGGFGTMDEFFEILTWRQLGLHDLPIVLLDALGFFDHLFSLLERMEREGLAPAADTEISTSRDPEETVRRILTSTRAARPKHT